MTFSDRHGYLPQDREISTREEASEEFRSGLISLAYGCGSHPHKVRSVLCQLLWRTPDESNWSAFPNVDWEARSLLSGCEWFEVYDFAEVIYKEVEDQEQFSGGLNKYFRRNGIGWQFVDGHVQVRGAEAFEQAVSGARELLKEQGQPTAANEIQEALVDLSRRPVPDITGSIHHAVAALECAAREVSNDQRGTLGEIIKRRPDLFPPPLDVAVKKLWGFASEHARHVREGRTPEHAEAEFCVHVSAAVASYLVKKGGAKGPAE